MMTSAIDLGLFDAFGIEIEYAIVDRQTCAARPIADRLLLALGGEETSEVPIGSRLLCSNELVLHVLELKTDGPAPELGGVAQRFDDGIREANQVLDPMGARLMPTSMHPLFDPVVETRLWPHEQDDIYRTFDGIFGCKRHGWSNLQSLHVNLPYRGDDELGRLHAAIRLVLPLIPALAASSPLVEGQATGFLDSRLEHYRDNASRIPSVAGHVIPERAFTASDYRSQILDVIARDVAPHDPAGVLDPEWTNSRGAIVRFVRRTIEIRVTDTQEHAAADLAVAAAIVTAVRALVEQRWVSYAAQRAWDERRLEAILRETIRVGGAATMDGDYAAVFGMSRPSNARALWEHLASELLDGQSEWGAPLGHILAEGTLAERILRRLGPKPKRDAIVELYRELCVCLAEGRALS